MFQRNVCDKSCTVSCVPVYGSYSFIVLERVNKRGTLTFFKSSNIFLNALKRRKSLLFIKKSI